MLLKAVVAVNARMDMLATKDELEYLKEHMATNKHIEALKDEFEYLGRDVDALKEDLEERPTRADVRAIVDRAKDEVLEGIEPIGKAVDKDAITIVDHEHRITSLETVRR